MKARIVAIAAVAFIAFHVVVLGGAGAYVTHLAGFDVPFLDHGHAAAGELSGPVAAVLGRLKTEEGFSGTPYPDSRLHPTIGYGTKLPITKAEGAWLLETRLADTHARFAKAWMSYGGLNQARQGALLDIAYEVGVEGLLGFHDMLAALERGDWAGAQAAALASLWAKEVPARAKSIAAALKNG